MPKFLVASAITALAIVGSTGCATKKFVGTSVGEVNDKVGSLSKSLEETQDRAQKNEARIRDVDQKAQAAQQASRQASEAATAAANLAKTVNAETDAIEKAQRRLVYEVVMSEQEGRFRFDSTDLPDSAKKQIDELVAKLKDEPKNVFITIEGYTDNVGSKAVNERIGLERAKAVQQYLYEKHQIPLHKMDVISYGEENPIAPNNTRGGRAQNRRVEIKVLA
jgi:outer membrane protein OmpA-like peptidoglycan-associated protein